MRQLFAVMLALALFAPTFCPSKARGAEETLTAERLAEIAADVYVYAYPLMLMKVTRDANCNVAKPVGMQAPVNQLGQAREFPDASFTTVVRPNADTLYSSMFYDVSAEPLLISIPAAKGRYWLFPALDAWTNVFASPGSRTTGDQAQTFALVGPNWQGALPPGVREYRSPTSWGWLIGRIQTNGRQDYANVHKFQDAISVRPLSAYGREDYVAPSQQTDPTIDMRTAPVRQVEEMSGEKFFTLFAELLKTSAPQAVDYPILDCMRQLGMEPGQSFVFASAPVAVRRAISAAPSLAGPRIKNVFQKAGNLVNGWKINLSAVGTYGADYLHRAGVAYAGLGANSIEDAVYPSAFNDINGAPLSSERRYVVHFSKEQLPPVRGFWSLSLYNERQFFAANPINRYAIGDRDQLAFNPDGSLDIYIQRQAPEAARMNNWLPAPASGQFTLNLRLYWPKPVVLEGAWSPPPVRSVP